MKVFRLGSRAVLKTVAWLLCGLALGFPSLAQKAVPGGVPKNPPPNYKLMSMAGLKTLAENGDAAAQNEVGLAYALGKKAKQDYKEAFKWFRMAAEKGFANAQYHLGGLYFYGSGVPKDYQEALKWYRKSADQSYIPAQYFLGWAYAKGKGVDENFKESVQWFKKAAEQGDAEAQLSLGLLHVRGEDLSPDFVEAYKWINLSAAQGNTNAIKHRGKLTLSMTPEQISEGQRRAVQFSEKLPGAPDSKAKPGSPPQKLSGK